MSGGFFDAGARQRQLDELQTLISDPGFWSDQERSSKTLQQRARLEEALALDRQISSQMDDAQALVDLAREGEPVQDELKSALAELRAFVEKVETQLLLSGENDRLNAIVNIHPGAGGTESQDWAEMLMRMYLRWAERSGFKTRILEIQDGEEAGIKSATFTISGDYAYGMMASETGVHRLVRISPFDAAKRRHTSFASLDVIPALDEEEAEEVEVDEADLRIDVYRSSGPGGQGVNTTDSAVRITHLPTGIVVSCQNERSQLQNRATAMGILKARLAELERRERDEQMDEIRGERKAVDFGSQIRSYVLAPYQMVKDHRTNEEVGDPQRVLDGDLDRFIEAELRHRASG